QRRKPSGNDEDTTAARGAAVVEDDGVGHKELKVLEGGKDDSPWIEPGGGFEIPDHAVLNVNGRGRIEHKPAKAYGLPIDDQSAQADDVAAARVDDNGKAAGRRHNAGLAASVVGDVDRPVDDQRAVVSGIDDADLAVGGGFRQGNGERCTGRDDGGAGVGVAAGA